MEEYKMLDVKFYHCNYCGKTIVIVGDNVNTPTICCNHHMVELKANSTDAAKEKHVPEVTINGDILNVQVGSTLHPMLENHYIEFVVLVTDKEIRRVNFKPGDKPIAEFNISNEKPLKVYEYCNLHGLWVKEFE